MVTQSDIDHWIANNYNVHFSGKHGVGKTQIITEAWNRCELDYVYLSGSTLDPWVDLIGIPKEQIDDENGKPYLGLIRPKCWANDEVEALFIDEYNRAPKAVRNAVMELIQFKSINGNKFHKLRFVWVACNPDNDANSEYDVEPLDPAQKDRFHVWVDIPYKPDVNYFTNKFGSKIATTAIGWWNHIAIPVREFVSPRRLDYALDGFLAGGNLKHFLPEGCNITELETKLNSSPIKERINELFLKKDDAASKTWWADENNYNTGIDIVKTKNNMMEYFLPLMPEEKIVHLISTEDNVRIKAVQAAENDDSFFKNIIKNIVEASGNPSVIEKIKEQQKKQKIELADTLDWTRNIFSSDFHGTYCKFADNANYTSDLIWLKKQNVSNTNERAKVFNHIKNKMPNDITKSQLSLTLSQIERVAVRSEVKTLNTFGDFIPIVNFLVLKAIDSFGIYIETLVKSYPATFEYCIGRIGFCFKNK